MPTSFDAKQFLSTLTERPGVYCMKDASEQVLYVGKANNLKKRVQNYFRPQGDKRLAALVSQIAKIDIMVTQSAKEALLLESNLIKSLKPRYNVILRDDKSYPYIALSHTTDFPQLLFYRGGEKKAIESFGPYPNLTAVSFLLDHLHKTFKLRSCEDSVFAHRTRPCLQYQIGRCSAPCVGYIDKADYQAQVELVKTLLLGKSTAVTEALMQQMQQAVAVEDYEQAAELRDQIRNLQSIFEKQRVSGSTGDVDIILLLQKAGLSLFFILEVREGKVVQGNSIIPKTLPPWTMQPEELLEKFLLEYYLGGHPPLVLPTRVLTVPAVSDPQSWQASCLESLGQKMVFATQLSKAEKDWYALAQASATAALERELAKNHRMYQRLMAVGRFLGLENTPEQIECFDVSHTFGTYTMGSCVVFTATGADAAAHRVYTLPVDTGDDYKALGAALQARYGGYPEKGKTLPEVLMIDGGKGQLQVAAKFFEELGVFPIRLLAIAKGQGRKPGLETLYIYHPEVVQEAQLASDSAVLQFFILVRDAAHKKAITAHRKKRQKSQTQTPIAAIPGIGPKRLQALLQHFGGMQGLLTASMESLASVPGISKKLATDLYQTLHRD